MRSDPVNATVAHLRRALLLLVALVASPAILGGEYGLSVGPSFPNPCERELSHTLNYCTTAAVVQDLREHFIAGRPFRIKAVEMAVLSGSISLKPDALAAFNEVIVAICVTESPHDFESLTKFLGYLPYRSLRERIAAELERTERRTSRARLQKALAALPPAKKRDR